ncbi:glycosyltransferase family 9 protein [Chitinophagaceae bacterium MMS25-I14]
MKKIKDAIALFIYRIILLIIKCIPVKAGSQRLVLIKTDEIGDYILFRAYFSRIKHAEKFTGYKTTLVANKAWKSLYELYDKDVFDDVIWIDKQKFKREIRYRLSVLSRIRFLKASFVINCVFSRSLNLDDGIAFICTGSNKIAMESDPTNRSSRLNIDRLIYTEIMRPGDEKMFDTERNRNFIGEIINQSLSITTHINATGLFEVPEKKYVALFVGAGNKERQWPLTHFTEAAKYVYDRYGLIPVICGGPGDEADARFIEENYDRSACINYAGKTTLPQLLSIFKNATFLICVDTGALHMAVAVGCPVVGLFSGKFYKRFAPYPAEISTSMYPVYPDFVDEMIQRNDPVLYDTSIMKNDTIKQIPFEKIKPFIDKIMAPLQEPLPY